MRAVLQPREARFEGVAGARAEPVDARDVQDDEATGEHRREREGDEQAGERGDDHHKRELAQQVSDQAVEERKRHEDDDVHQRDGDCRKATLGSTI